MSAEPARADGPAAVGKGRPAVLGLNAVLAVLVPALAWAAGAAAFGTATAAPPAA